MAFGEQELSDCADELAGILYDLKKNAQENAAAIEILEKAQSALLDVLYEFEEYEIGGAFAAMVGNNSEFRALYKENVQFAVGCIDEVLNNNG